VPTSCGTPVKAPRLQTTSLDISRTAPMSLLTCDDGGESPHPLVIALVEGAHASSQVSSGVGCLLITLSDST
jgi:hypothetical protein